MIDEAEYRALKKKAEDAKTERDKAQGQLDAAMATLRDEFGCDTIEEAQEKMKKLEAEATKTEAAYETAKSKFETDWNERLRTA